MPINSNKKTKITKILMKAITMSKLEKTTAQIKMSLVFMISKEHLITLMERVEWRGTKQTTQTRTRQTSTLLALIRRSMTMPTPVATTSILKQVATLRVHLLRRREESRQETLT